VSLPRWLDLAGEVVSDVVDMPATAWLAASYMPYLFIEAPFARPVRNGRASAELAQSAATTANRGRVACGVTGESLQCSRYTLVLRDFGPAALRSGA
jgi:hypothetical protein